MGVLPKDVNELSGSEPEGIRGTAEACCLHTVRQILKVFVFLGLKHGSG